MRQKAFSPAVLSKKPFFKLHMLHIHHMPDTHQAYDVFFSFFELLRSFSNRRSPQNYTSPVNPSP